MSLKTFQHAKLKQELSMLYKYFPEIKSLMKTWGCDKTTAEDLFQEALIIYIRKREDLNFEQGNLPIHYIKQTCKWLWMNEARKQQKQNALQSLPFSNEESDAMEREMQFKQLEKAFERLGSQCKELLQQFYTWGKSMVEIAKNLGLRNDKVAKAQKYRCIQKAKELIQQEMSTIVKPINL